MQRTYETYFGNNDIMYPALSADQCIPIEQFLRASQGIADFVAFLGVAFTPVKSDVEGNVIKVRTKCTADPKLNTIQELVEADLKENDGKLGVATEGLLWLKRGLELLLCFIELLVEDHESGKRSENLVEIIRAAYDKALKRHHGFISKQLFKLVIHAAPYRSSLLKAVAFGCSDMEQQCVRDMNLYLPTFRQNIFVLSSLYLDKGLETPNDPQPSST